jgi:hypothetical protein
MGSAASAAMRQKSCGDQSPASADAVSRPKNRPGRRAWSPKTILRTLETFDMA